MPQRLAHLEFKDASIAALLDSADKTLWTLTLGKDAEGGGRFVRFDDEKKGYQASMNLYIDATAKNWADTLLVDLNHAQKPDAPIRLDPKNPHYFLYAGKTIPLVTSGEHYGSVMNADFDYHKYLATIEAVNLNYTRIFGGSYVEVPGGHSASSAIPWRRHPAGLSCPGRGVPNPGMPVAATSSIWKSGIPSTFAGWAIF